VVILAVDLGLWTGLACYAVDDSGDDGGDDGGDARLSWFRAQHFATVTVLKRAIPRVLDEAPGLSLLVLEGDRHLGDLWAKLAQKRGAAILRVAPEQWRMAMLLPRDQRDGATAKAAAVRLAHEIIAASDARRPKTALVDDVAEAIVIGAWAARRPRR
jgi:hypothetical protein